MAKQEQNQLSEGTSEFADKFRLDPYSFYRGLSASRARKAKGLERFAYKIFGPQFISSLAFALDPLSWTRIPTARVSPPTRSRNMTSIFYRARQYSLYRESENCQNHPNPETPLDIWDRTPVKCVTTIDRVSNFALPAQEAIRGYMEDTTFETRPQGSPGGEFELFAPQLNVPPRSIQQTAKIKVRYYPGDGTEQVADSRKTNHRACLGPWAYFTQAQIDSVLAMERNTADQLIPQHTPGLILGLIPSRPVFASVYNIGELKDLPMLLRKSVGYYRDPTQVFEVKGMGDQYLNLKFGWESTIRSVRDLLKTPERVANRVNWLLSRSGKATNLHSIKQMPLEVSSVPTCSYQLMSNETFKSFGNLTKRDAELRCAINAKIVLPNIEPPKLREELLLEAWGAKPTPTDVYNLTPWSWLVDWFTGLGEYVQILDKIYQDRSLFNFGYVSYVSKGNVVYTLKTDVTDTWYTNMDGNITSGSIIRKHNANAKFSWRYHKRVDISGIPGVRAISQPSTLGADQLAIIGALLTKWSGS